MREWHEIALEESSNNWIVCVDVALEDKDDYSFYLQYPSEMTLEDMKEAMVKEIETEIKEEESAVIYIYHLGKKVSKYYQEIEMIPKSVLTELDYH